MKSSASNQTLKEDKNLFSIDLLSDEVYRMLKRHRFFLLNLSTIILVFLAFEIMR
jgi:hypothetical protein